MKKKPFTILSLGGSLIFPKDGPDVKFLRGFSKLIRDRIKKGDRFVLICGGGAVCRIYQNTLNKVKTTTPDELDWLGIHVTHLNAHFIKAIFNDIAYDKIIINPTKKISTKKSLIIGAGWKPGCSTDYDAVLLAKNLKADTLINLSNIDYIYDSDPKINSTAKPIKKLTWSELRQMFGTKWQPGLNRPFDPKAVGEAERLGLHVITIQGKKLKNLSNILDGKKFQGTIIE